MSTKKPVTISGTREWSSSSFNCVLGCSHGCKYCFARHDAEDRFHTVKPSEWRNEKIIPERLLQRFHKRKGTIMFPTQHDITPGTLEACLIVLENMLKAGNSVLIVSKPHLECIRALCLSLEKYKAQLMFRFTIGTYTNELLSFWEPGAPLWEERLASLKYAYDAGFRTSISMEPCLNWDNVVETFHLLEPYVTDSIWVGTMNKIDERVLVNPEDWDIVKRLQEQQNMENFQRVYAALKDCRVTRWKDSMKKALGLPLVTEAGTDQ